MASSASSATNTGLAWKASSGTGPCRGRASAGRAGSAPPGRAVRTPARRRARASGAAIPRSRRQRRRRLRPGSRRRVRGPVQGPARRAPGLPPPPAPEAAAVPTAALPVRARRSARPAPRRRRPGWRPAARTRARTRAHPRPERRLPPPRTRRPDPAAHSPSCAGGSPSCRSCRSRPAGSRRRRPRRRASTTWRSCPPGSSRNSSLVAVSPSFSLTSSIGRSSHLGWGTPITARHRRLGVAHGDVLDVDRADPLAARLDHVLGPVGDLHEAVVVDGGHVAGVEEALVVEDLAARAPEVLGGDDRARDLQAGRSSCRRAAGACPRRRSASAPRPAAGGPA